LHPSLLKGAYINGFGKMVMVVRVYFDFFEEKYECLNAAIYKAVITN